MIKIRQHNKPRLLAQLVSLAILISINGRLATAQPSVGPSTNEPASLKAEGENPQEKTIPDVALDSAVQAPVGPPPEPPTVSMECSPKPTPIAAPVTCVVTISHSPEMTVQVTAPPGAESGAATLPKAEPNGQLVTKRLFMLRQLELNKPLRVKGVKVRWSAIGGHEGVIELPQEKIPVKVQLMGVSDPKVRDLKNPTGLRVEEGVEDQKQISTREAFWRRHTPPSLTEYNWTLLIILGALAVSLIGIFLGWLIRLWFEIRNRNKGPYVDPRPAHVIAYEALETLNKARLIEEGAFKIYSHRLSEILRAYFGKRYDLNGLEMTSDELREALQNLELSSDTWLVLEDFLSDTDLIKFADLSTSAHALEESKQQVYRLIELTKVAEVEGLEDSKEQSEGNDHKEKEEGL